MGPFESALRSARALDAKIIRYGLTTVLCGDRHALGDEMAGAGRRGSRRARRPRAARVRRRPNAGDREPSGFRQRRAGRLLRGDAAASASASTPATRSRSPRRRSTSPAASRRMCGTSISRTIACSSPTKAIAWCAARSATAPCRSPRCSTSWRRSSETLTAVLEPGALEARHVRFLRPEWWSFYPPKPASALAACLAAARVNRLADDADYAHALGARRGRRDRRLRTRHDPPQRRQHARARPWPPRKETDGMTKELSGKIAFVTGSGRGLGRAMAERLAELGADVAIHDIILDRAGQIRRGAGSRRRRQGDRPAWRQGRGGHAATSATRRRSRR